MLLATGIIPHKARECQPFIRVLSGIPLGGEDLGQDRDYNYDYTLFAVLISALHHQAPKGRLDHYCG